MNNNRPLPHGRGSGLAPPNRFGLPVIELDGDFLDADPDAVAAIERPKTQYLRDDSKSVVTENDSPDVWFRYSLNPYRGCLHGCAYCFARPSHEFLGYNAGIEFETKILVKPGAAELFRTFLARDGWVPEAIALSGVTDPYQPVERRLGITRQCLEVAAEANQPVGIVTKNALVERDLDVLGPMAARGLVHAVLSVTTLDAELARSMEPRTSSPAARLRAIASLTAAGVPVRVLVAPIVPGLNDSEIPAILAAVKAAGAVAASYILLRLPWAVAPVFLDWLDRRDPAIRQRVEGRIRAARGGKLYQSGFGTRMRGTGKLAEQIEELFGLFARKHWLDGKLPSYDFTKFRPPKTRNTQGRLF
ncbi:MAG TPA: PA0069 family radical SAM protein [Fimbriiglobus sp.]